MPRLSIDIRPGETVRIGDAVVTMQHKTGRVAHLSIDAPISVRIDVDRKRGANDETQPTTYGVRAVA